MVAYKWLSRPIHGKSSWLKRAHLPEQGIFCTGRIGEGLSSETRAVETGRDRVAFSCSPLLAMAFIQR